MALVPDTIQGWSIVAFWNQMIEGFRSHFGIPPDLFAHLFYTVIIVVLLFTARNPISKFICRKATPQHAKILYNIARQAINFLAIVLLFNIWSSNKGGLASFLGVPHDVMDKVISSILILIFYFIGSRISSWFLLLTPREYSLQYSLNKTAHFVLGIVVVVAFVKIWIVGGASLSTFLGLFSAGLAIALQDLVVSIAGWVFLMTAQPFKVGQRVQIANHIGDVVDIRLFQFSIQEIGNWVDGEQATGRILHLPNSYVFKHPLANYNAGFEFIWSELPIIVTFESNWKKALSILRTIAKEHATKLSTIAAHQVKEAASEFMFAETKFDPVVWVSVADHGVNLTVRYLTSPKKKRSTDSDLWQAVLGAFQNANDIDLAYPTQRFYDNREEGKPGAGGIHVSQPTGTPKAQDTKPSSQKDPLKTPIPTAR